MPITKMLDVTTGHLKKQDREALKGLSESQKIRAGSEASSAPLVYDHHYGWYISAGMMYGEDLGEEQARLRDEGFSEEFIDLMTYAKQKDVAMINFDADAEPEPGFPVFDENTDELVSEHSASNGM